jgi:hypothetical protein
MRKNKNSNKERSASAKLRQTKEKQKRFFGESVFAELNLASQQELDAPAMRILRSMR